ncbi:MAG: terminase TerL endonuclease subunit, partial [Clostridia bacterium]
CGTDKTLKDMNGKACYAGLDLSSGGDLTSLSLEFPLENDKFYIYSHSFMPRKRLNEHIKTDLAPYDLWESQGLLTVTDTLGGVKNDYKFIVSQLKEILTRYNIKLLGIGYDNHNADGFLGDLEEFGVPLVSVTQSAKFLNDATVDFELTAKAKNIEYDKKNELMTWSMLNAVLTQNSFGEVKVDKEVNSRNKRIDVVDSVIDAHVLGMKKVEQVDLNKHADDYFKIMGW